MKEFKIFILFSPIVFFSSLNPFFQMREKIIIEKKILNSDSTLQTGWYYLVDAGNGVRRTLEGDTAKFYLDPNPIVTDHNITKIKIKKNSWGSFFLSMEFDTAGTKAWSYATGESIGKQLGFIIDNRLVYIPTVQQQITKGVTAFSTGNNSKQELKETRRKICNEKN